MDLTRKKQVVNWQTSPVGVFKLRHCGLDTIFRMSRSHLGLEGWTSHLISVLRVWENGTSQSRGFNVSVSSRSWEFEKWNVSVSSRSCDLTSCGHPWVIVPRCWGFCALMLLMMGCCDGRDTNSWCSTASDESNRGQWRKTESTRVKLTFQSTADQLLNFNSWACQTVICAVNYDSNVDCKVFNAAMLCLV